MTSIKSDGIPQKCSFQQETISSAHRKSNIASAKKVDSLDLHLSATYDHQYDLFVNKTEIVSQLQKIEQICKKKEPQGGTDSIFVTIGKIIIFRGIERETSFA